jgi:ABC-type polysaccharide/polyol phosphate transport system ATPase subunit
MSGVVIRVQSLGKRYRIGQRERYLALRDVLARAVSVPTRFLRSRNGTSSNGDSSHIWALKDASFEIRHGEVVAIIGRNGAGKSTLLKILARVTKPTQGFAEVRGRMGTLLEVGTGFHPELTGRENVFLCGAILGMSKAEICRKFDEIVAFAEVEKFIDTALKHYSSGMQMRLAFAIAAHLEPEILLVDEVLAVGDLEFQKKCLGKMGDVANQGRTILFVSHQMNQIRRLCRHAIWLQNGRVRQIGVAEEVLSAYEESATTAADRPVNSGDRAQGRCTGFVEWEVITPRGSQRHSVADGTRPVGIKIEFRTERDFRHGRVTALIYDNDRHLLAGWAFEKIHLSAGAHDFILQLSALPLRPAAYDLFIKISDDHSEELWNVSPPLVIEGAPVTHFMDEWAGFLNIACRFSVSSTGPLTECASLANRCD